MQLVVVQELSLRLCDPLPIGMFFGGETQCSSGIVPETSGILALLFQEVRYPEKTCGNSKTSEISQVFIGGAALIK